MARSPKIPDPQAGEMVRALSYAAPALEKGFNIIELLADAPHGLTMTEIAARLGVSMGEIFRVIMVMERRAWLRKGDDDRYRVTPKVLDLAFRATPAEEMALVAGPLMRQLAYRIDQSCHLVVRSDDHGLVILRQQNPGPTGFSVRVGAHVPLETSCSGHVLLAFDTRAQPAAGDLQTVLERVRSQGYELVRSARTQGVTDISYPIFGFDGRIAAALTVPFLKLLDGSQEVDQNEARKLLAETARVISVELGGTGK